MFTHLFPRSTVLALGALLTFATPTFAAGPDGGQRGDRGDRGDANGNANFGDRGDSNRGDRGDANFGDRGDSNRGDRGDSNRGDRGDSNRGDRGDSNRGGAANTPNWNAPSFGNNGRHDNGRDARFNQPARGVVVPTFQGHGYRPHRIQTGSLVVSNPFNFQVRVVVNGQIMGRLGAFDRMRLPSVQAGSVAVSLHNHNQVVMSDQVWVSANVRNAWSPRAPRHGRFASRW